MNFHEQQMQKHDEAHEMLLQLQTHYNNMVNAKDMNERMMANILYNQVNTNYEKHMSIMYMSARTNYHPINHVQTAA